MYMCMHEAESVHQARWAAFSPADICGEILQHIQLCCHVTVTGADALKVKITCCHFADATPASAYCAS